MWAAIAAVLGGLLALIPKLSALFRPKPPDPVEAVVEKESEMGKAAANRPGDAETEKRLREGRF